MGIQESCCEDQKKGAQFIVVKNPQTNKLEKRIFTGKKQTSNLPAYQQQSTNPSNELNKKEGVKYQQSSIKMAQQNLINLPSKLSSLNLGEQSEVKQYDLQLQNKKSQILRPQLALEVQKTIKQNYFYQSQLHSDLQYRQFGKDIYFGRLDSKNQLPHGFGKFYKEDRSYYMGQFMNGKAQGRGVFIFADGSFYSGYFQQNCAQCSNGHYKSNSFEYIGAFKQNLFHYKGKEKSKFYTFQGQYEKGHRTFGKLSWISEGRDYVYEGSFNQNNEFHGKGTLIEPTGQYKGSFLKGKQNGFGVYKYTNNFRYQGMYKQGLKSGKGVIYNQKNQILFRGQLVNGLPHGIGEAVDINGKVLSVVWDEDTSINI